VSKIITILNSKKYQSRLTNNKSRASGKVTLFRVTMYYL